MIGSDAEYNPAFIAQFDRNDAWYIEYNVYYRQLNEGSWYV